MEIWAKSSRTKLHQHINDILKTFDVVKNKAKEGLRKEIELAIVLHDFGKVLPSFQIKVLGNKNYEPFDIIYEIPHSLFSLFFINEKKLEEIVKKVKYVKFILSSVAYHHWKDNFSNLINRYNEDLIRAIENLEKYEAKLKDNLLNEIEKIENVNIRDLAKKLLVFDKGKTNAVKNGYPLSEIAVPPYLFDFEPLRGEIDKEWVLISGFLQRCDHFASWCEEENESLQKVEIELNNFESVKNAIINKIRIGENSIWQIKKIQEENLMNKNLILLAPTGIGKTEFAFLMNSENKFIYTLPLRSAVNQIFERAKEVFGDDKVGLLHSDADIYLLGKQGDVGDSIVLYELAKNLSYPVIISTGDQFFPYALRPPGYEKILALFFYANLVIDEVQAYNPKACAIVVKFIEWVYQMGGKFLLMTATLPEFIKNILKEKKIINETDVLNMYEEKKEVLQNMTKHKIKVKIISNEEKKEIELPNEYVEEIIKSAKNNKRVLVILNTVDMAQRVYEKIKEKAHKMKINLLHSRFTIENRRKKEEEMEREFKNPKSDDEEEKIFVATQVIEASLDIDADVLFTEICPLDALIQRMGRVLRRYKYDNSENISKIDEPNVYVWIFKNGLESGERKVYEKELLRLSIAWLWKKSEENVENCDFNEENKYDFFERQFERIISSRSSLTGRRRGSSRNEKVYDIITTSDEWIANLNNDFCVAINEYEKYKLTNLFYKSLNKNGDYLKNFYETLDILNLGYMSARKIEAQNIFREIYNVRVIPLSDKKLEDISNDAINSSKNYTQFKKDFLSKYVVNVPLGTISNVLDPSKLALNLLSPFLEKKLCNLPEVDRRNIFSKLGRWLSGIYILEIGYNDLTGLRINRESIRKYKFEEKTI